MFVPEQIETPPHTVWPPASGRSSECTVRSIADRGVLATVWLQRAIRYFFLFKVDLHIVCVWCVSINCLLGLLFNAILDNTNLKLTLLDETETNPWFIYECVPLLKNLAGFEDGSKKNSILKVWSSLAWLLKCLSHSCYHAVCLTDVPSCSCLSYCSWFYN